MKLIFEGATIFNEAKLKKTHQTANTKIEPGKGVQTTYKGKLVLIGNMGHMQDHGIDVSFSSKNSSENDLKNQIINKSREKGNTGLFVSCDGKFIGAIMVTDQLRPNAERVIQVLEEQGISPRVFLQMLIN